MVENGYQATICPLHPARGCPGGRAVVVASARGRTVTDVDGKEYLDCFSGISVVNAGHNHPPSWQRPGSRWTSWCTAAPTSITCRWSASWPRSSPAITPGELKKSFFCNSGAEANEGAMRLAKQHTGRREIVALAYGFHGRTFGTLSITGNRARKKNSGPYLLGRRVRPSAVLLPLPAGPEYPSCDLACADALRDVIRSADCPATWPRFVVEPVLGEGGIITPPAEYLGIAAGIFHEEGALFIVDEVQTGFGRTGKMFGIEHFGRVHARHHHHGQGHRRRLPAGRLHGPRTGLRRDEAGRPPLDLRRQPDLLRRRPGQHRRHRGGGSDRQRRRPRRGNCWSGAAACRRNIPLIGDVRGRGLMIGLELVRDRKTKEPAPAQAKALRAALRERGVLVGVGGVFANVVRLQPPLSITAEECERAAVALGEALTECARA